MPKFLKWRPLYCYLLMKFEIRCCLGAVYDYPQIYKDVTKIVKTKISREEKDRIKQIIHHVYTVKKNTLREGILLRPRDYILHLQLYMIQ